MYQRALLLHGTGRAQTSRRGLKPATAAACSFRRTNTRCRHIPTDALRHDAPPQLHMYQRAPLPHSGRGSAPQRHRQAKQDYWKAQGITTGNYFSLQRKAQAPPPAASGKAKGLQRKQHYKPQTHCNMTKAKHNNYHKDSIYLPHPRKISSPQAPAYAATPAQLHAYQRPQLLKLQEYGSPRRTGRSCSGNQRAPAGH